MRQEAAARGSGVGVVLVLEDEPAHFQVKLRRIGQTVHRLQRLVLPGRLDDELAASLAGQPRRC
jgi:hypothetical protein